MFLYFQDGGMNQSTPQPVAEPATLVDGAAALAAFGLGFDDIDVLDDDSRLAAQRAHSELSRAVETYGVWIASAIAKRSTHPQGYSGLAKKHGFLTPEALIQSISGATSSETKKLVQMGRIVGNAVVPSSADAAGDGPTAQEEARLWRTVVAEALVEGRISVDAAEGIYRGLNGADDRVASADLAAAAVQLVELAQHLAADLLFRQARELRDVLDAGGVAAREKLRRSQRYFTARRQPNGMVSGSYLLSDEDAELMLAIADSAINPRKSPRFGLGALSAGGAPRGAGTIDDDKRSGGQRIADTIVATLRLGVDADGGTVFGGRRPAVRVIVSATSRDEREGHGNFEGSGDPISLTTVDRFECEGGVLGVMFDDAVGVVNIGRTQRLFTRRQLAAMAVRDGGCRFPGCERPPAWTEGHHIKHWLRDHGETNVDLGILLCRTHHMLVHDNHWEIERRDGEFWLKPPPEVDPEQRLRPMPTHSRAMRDFARSRFSARQHPIPPIVEEAPAVDNLTP
jgi:hypothetical protein